MVITHNQIIKLFSDIATNHYQINEFGFGDTWEVGASGKINYPLMWGTVNPSSVGDNVMLLNYSLYFLDRVKKDEGNENEVLSDQLLIAQDVFSILCSDTYSDYFVMTRSAQFSNFPTEYLDDELSGVKMDVQFRIFYDTNRCQIPQASTPTILASTDGIVTGIRDTIDSNSPSGILESL